MSDHDVLIKAILANPREDTPRLALADWLDEHGTDDRARATSEFIRTACRPGKPSPQMPAAAYAWLDGNWRRLVPSVLALHVGYDDSMEWTSRRNWLQSEYARLEEQDPTLVWARVGRTVQFCGVRTWPAAFGPKRPFRVGLTFWKGFVIRFRGWDTGGIVRQALTADQPLLVANRFVGIRT